MATSIRLKDGTLYCHICGQQLMQWDEDTLAWETCPHVAFVYEWLLDGPDTFLHVRPDCAEEFLEYFLDSVEYGEYLDDGNPPIHEHDRERFCSGDLREEDDASTLFASWGWEHPGLASEETVVYCCDRMYSGCHVGVVDD